VQAAATSDLALASFGCSFFCLGSLGFLGSAAAAAAGVAPLPSGAAPVRHRVILSVILSHRMFARGRGPQGEAGAGELDAPFASEESAEKSTYSGVLPILKRNLSKSVTHLTAMWCHLVTREPSHLQSERAHKCSERRERAASWVHAPAGVMRVDFVLVKGWKTSRSHALNLTSNSSRTAVAPALMIPNGVTDPGATESASAILSGAAIRTGADLGTPSRSEICVRWAQPPPPHSDERTRGLHMMVGV
jgi:hypothetical protein